VILGTLGVKSGKGSNSDVLEHKSEENAKDLIFHAGTVFDGVKRKNLTASRVNIMTTQYKT
jgi:hypothetical protein